MIEGGHRSSSIRAALTSTRILTALVLVGALLLGACGGDDEGEELTSADVRANLEAVGYEVSEDITNGANKALPPDGTIDAESMFLADTGTEQPIDLEGGSVYFFTDSTDATTVADSYDNPEANEVVGTRMYQVASLDLDSLAPLVDAGEDR